jgi:hypothetical protein
MPYTLVVRFCRIFTGFSATRAGLRFRVGVIVSASRLHSPTPEVLALKIAGKMVLVPVTFAGGAALLT